MTISEALSELNKLDESTDEYFEIANKCDELWDSLVDNPDQLHLCGYDEIIELQRKFESSLYRNKCDLSWVSTISPKYGFKIGGNACGIASGYIYQFTTKQWNTCDMTKEELKNYLKDNPNIKCYKSGKYYSVEEVNRDKIINTSFGTTYRDQGIGSQASTHEETIELRKDKFGNLLIQKSYVI